MDNAILSALKDIESRLEKAGAVQTNIFPTGRGGEARLMWYDKNLDTEMHLDVTAQGWELAAPSIGLKDIGFSTPPDMNSVLSAYDRMRANAIDEEAVSISAENMFEQEASAIMHEEKRAVIDYEIIQPLQRDYLGEGYIPKPGDFQLILASEGANAIWDAFREFRSRVAIKDIQYERIEKLRFAGTDRHIDRGTITFKAHLIAGPAPHKKATISIDVKIKDGEIITPLKFKDSSHKERILCEESLVKFLNLQENARGRTRRVPDTDKAQVDRTLYPSPRANTMFRSNDANDNMFRNL